MSKKDLTGRRYHTYVVTGLETEAVAGAQARWNIRCDCGIEKSVRHDKVYFGCEGKNCGAEWRVFTTRNNYKYRPEYTCWHGLRQRCRNPKASGYIHYGGRGIKVCERWDIFELFLEDMGLRPSPSHSIDRIDVNGDYEPDNCRWATPAEQSANKRPRCTLAGTKS